MPQHGPHPPDDHPPELTRRRALQLAATPLISLTLGPAAGAAQSSHAPFTFIAVNDLHFSDADCSPFFDNVVASMKASASDLALCLIAGDVTDTAETAQFRGVRTAFDALGAPVYTVPGNHDHLTDSDRSTYDAAFPDRLNYTFTHQGWQFIGLDTTQGTDFAETRVSQTTLDWLDATLPNLDPSAPTVAFTHFPLGPKVTYRPLNADAVLSRLQKLNLVAAFSGHWHGLNEHRIATADLVTNRCCARIRGNRDGSPLKGWWVCEARPDRTLRRRFVALAPALSGAQP